MNFKGKVVTAFGLASATLLSMGSFSYRDMSRTATDETWEAHTHFVREELEQLLSDSAEAQGSERSYILTNEEIYSASLDGALAK